MIQKETGWTDDYLLWETSWANIQMKLADAPRYHYGDGESTTKRVEDRAEIKTILMSLK
jgi:hypothetical protein